MRGLQYDRVVSRHLIPRPAHQVLAARRFPSRDAAVVLIVSQMPQRSIRPPKNPDTVPVADGPQPDVMDSSLPSGIGCQTEGVINSRREGGVHHIGLAPQATRTRSASVGVNSLRTGRTGMRMSAPSASARSLAG